MEVAPAVVVATGSLALPSRPSSSRRQTRSPLRARFNTRHHPSTGSRTPTTSRRSKKELWAADCRNGSHRRPDRSGRPSPTRSCDGTLGRSPDARREGLQRRNRSEHRRHSPARSGSARAEARRAQRCDLPERQTLSAREEHLRSPRRTRAQPRAEIPRRAVLQELRSRRRPAVGSRQDQASRL